MKFLMLWAPPYETAFLDVLREMNLEVVLVVTRDESMTDFSQYPNCYVEHHPRPDGWTNIIDLMHWFHHDVMDGVYERWPDIEGMIPALSFEQEYPFFSEKTKSLIPIPYWWIEKSAYSSVLPHLGVRMPKMYDLIVNDAPPDITKVHFPCVAKPSIGSGSMGTQVIHSPALFLEFFHRTQEEPQSRMMNWKQGFRGHYNYVSWGQPYLIQEYIPGSTVGAAISVYSPTEVEVHTTFDIEYVPHDAFRGECGYMAPSAIPHVEDAIRDMFLQLGSLGIPRGPWMVDVQVNPNGVYLLDLSPRPNANAISNLYAERGNHDYLYHSISLFLGLDTPHRGLKQVTPSYERLLSFSPGVVDTVTLPSSLPETVRRFECHLVPGFQIFQPRMTIHQKYQGYLYLSGSDSDTLRSDAESVINQIKITYRND